MNAVAVFPEFASAPTAGPAIQPASAARAQSVLGRIDSLAHAMESGDALIDGEARLNVLAGLRADLAEELPKLYALADTASNRSRGHLLFFGGRAVLIHVADAECAGDLQHHATHLSGVVAAAVRGVATIARTEDDSDPAGWTERVCVGVELLANFAHIVELEVAARSKSGGACGDW